MSEDELLDMDYFLNDDGEDELLDMDYFLNDDDLDDDFGEEGFYIF